MASNKLGRTNDDIQMALATLLRSIKDPRVQQGMISVTRVEAAGDLRTCKVWLSVYGLTNEKEFFKGLKSASGWLRRELGKAVQLRDGKKITDMDANLLERLAFKAAMGKIAGSDLEKLLKEYKLI